ncbi:Sec-independent protein translocase subunit TatA/TatB [Hymenobacter canadensis]|uniref:Sec-independent protein translocase subunit TatA/TatB n=1 Tax=Hymenobacter canadensis TaxID=2999067 RepID=UPI0033140387
MHTPLFLFLEGIGGGEMMLVLVVILIFFGANKIPELARGLGKGIREFKDASQEIRSEFENAGTQQQAQQPYQQQFNPNYVDPATTVAQQPIVQHPTVQPGHQALPDAAYAAPETAPATTYVPPIAPPMDGGITPPAAAPAERPRLDQMS